MPVYSVYCKFCLLWLSLTMLRNIKSGGSSDLFRCSLMILKYAKAIRYSRPLWILLPMPNYLQWNPSITATIGEWRFGPYREVAFREGSCFFLLFSSSHISLHPVITLSKRRRLHSLMEQDCNSTETTIVLLNTLYSYHTESHKN